MGYLGNDASRGATDTEADAEAAGESEEEVDGLDSRDGGAGHLPRPRRQAGRQDAGIAAGVTSSSR